MAKRVVIPRATELGRRAAGNVYVTDEAIGFGTFGMRHPTLWTDVESVTVTGDVTRRSRAGKLVLFGPFGLLARGTQDRATIVVRLKDGGEVGFQVRRLDAANVRARVRPFAVAAGVDVP